MLKLEKVTVLFYSGANVNIKVEKTSKKIHKCRK
jgi:hypothetical protein